MIKKGLLSLAAFVIRIKTWAKATHERVENHEERLKILEEKQGISANFGPTPDPPPDPDDS